MTLEFDFWEMNVDVVCYIKLVEKWAIEKLCSISGPVCLSPPLIVKSNRLELINVANHVGCDLSKLSSLMEEIASLFDVVWVCVFHLVPQKRKWGNASSCSCNNGVK
ncbi:unnamed protein product [Citrullus colocynthis]|uniref:Uncharacterized protein n=1 Tax=Citrullus colocynthis TaxID=252529 RepID=A0ABP0Z0M4_9ROSI